MTTETRRNFWLDKPEEFYRWSILENRYVRVEGKPVHFDGWGEIDAFLAKHPVEGWNVYHGPDGCVFYDTYENCECPVFAVLGTKDCLEEINKEYFIENMLLAITRHGGLSPRYRWENEVQE